MKSIILKTKYFHLSKIPILITLIGFIALMVLSVIFRINDMEIRYIIGVILISEFLSLFQKTCLYSIFSSRIRKLSLARIKVYHKSIENIIYDNYDFYWLMFWLTLILHIALIAFILFNQSPDKLWPQLTIICILSAHISINMKLANKSFDLSYSIKNFTRKEIY